MRSAPLTPILTICICGRRTIGTCYAKKKIPDRAIQRYFDGSILIRVKVYIGKGCFDEEFFFIDGELYAKALGEQFAPLSWIRFLREICF